jgi:hypothetical protein
MFTWSCDALRTEIIKARISCWKRSSKRDEEQKGCIGIYRKWSVLSQMIVRNVGQMWSLVSFWASLPGTKPHSVREKHLDRWIESNSVAFIMRIHFAEVEGTLFERKVWGKVRWNCSTVQFSLWSNAVDILNRLKTYLFIQRTQGDLIFKSRKIHYFDHFSFCTLLQWNKLISTPNESGVQFNLKRFCAIFRSRCYGYNRVV